MLENLHRHYCEVNSKVVRGSRAGCWIQWVHRIPSECIQCSATNGDSSIFILQSEGICSWWSSRETEESLGDFSYNMDLQPVCMFDRFHLTFNFRSKVSRDVFNNKKECRLTSTNFSQKCHLNVICLVIRVMSICKSVNWRVIFSFTSHMTCRDLNRACQLMRILFLCEFLRVKYRKLAKSFVKNIHRLQPGG